MVDDIVSLLPSSRKGWARIVIVLGVALCAVVWFAGPPAAATAGTAGGVAGFASGIGALTHRRRGSWWAAAGLLLIAAGIVGFVLLRGATNCSWFCVMLRRYVLEPTRGGGGVCA